MNQSVFLSLLALDAYNRGYDQSLVTNSGDNNEGQDEAGRRVGSATVFASNITSEARAAGFYAIAYEWNGETIISYRGTDFNGDIVNGWPIGAGIVTEKSAQVFKQLRCGFFIVLFGMLLVGCSASGEDTPDRTPDYRYRLTVEVDTPVGLKTGSSVIEVVQTIGPAGVNPERSQIYRKVRGEAVAVDLPSGQTLYALLRSRTDRDWAARVFLRYAAESAPSPAINPGNYDRLFSIEGEVELPREWPSEGPVPRFDGYPVLVVFDDLADPTTVKEVDPDKLSIEFGESIALRRITLELTDEPVTFGVEEHLPWLAEVGQTRASLVKIPPKYIRDSRPVDLIRPSDFSTELYR
ncbi:MAG: hypothetical protein AAGH57_05795 [Pseudomonadota bacterium]